MEKSPSQRTPLMEMFLDAQREKLQEQLKNARKYRHSREEQARAIAEAERAAKERAWAKLKELGIDPTSLE